MTIHPEHPEHPDHPDQPVDEWDYLSNDDESPGTPPAVREQPAAEVAAMHVRADHTRSPAWDPGRTDVAMGADGDGGDGPRYFADEEPEQPGSWPAGSVPAGASSEDEHEPDLGEILESQHYAFGDDDTDRAEQPSETMG